MKRESLGLKVEKDGSYARLIVFLSGSWCFLVFGLSISHHVFTAIWKAEFGLDFRTASLYQTVVSFFRYFSNIMVASKFWMQIFAIVINQRCLNVGTLCFSLRTFGISWKNKSRKWGFSRCGIDAKKKDIPKPPLIMNSVINTMCILYPIYHI